MTGPMGRGWTPLDRCNHSGPAIAERTKGGYTVRCMVCQTVGPARTSPEAARKALLVLGARNEVPREQGPVQAHGDDRFGKGTP
jgi:hypothetical protein